MTTPPGTAALAHRLRAQMAARSTGGIVCLDGPAASGKTTLANALGRAAGVTVVHTDDVLPGWSGLPLLPEALDDLVAAFTPTFAPASPATTGSYRRYDWHLGCPAELVEVARTPWLVLEGVGSGSLRHARATTLLVWVEHTDAAERMRRGLERDGEAVAPHWRQWTVDEQLYFARERVRERADVRLVDGAFETP